MQNQHPLKSCVYSLLSYVKSKRKGTHVQLLLGKFTQNLPEASRTGSVLGPLLFLLYINDFSKSSNIFDFRLFADDANLFYEAKNLSALETTVNHELTNVYIWLCANRLSLNIDKSNYVLFHPPQRNNHRFSFSLSINNHQLKREYCITVSCMCSEKD